MGGFLTGLQDKEDWRDGKDEVRRTEEEVREEGFHDEKHEEKRRDDSHKISKGKRIF